MLETARPKNMTSGLAVLLLSGLLYTAHGDHLEASELRWVRKVASSNSSSSSGRALIKLRRHLGEELYDPNDVDVCSEAVTDSGQFGQEKEIFAPAGTIHDDQTDEQIDCTRQHACGYGGGHEVGVRARKR
jgi:hypothetical protein